MPIKKIIFTFCVMLVSLAQAQPSILNNTTHAATFIAPAVNAVLGAGKVDNPIFIDYKNDAQTMVAAAVNALANYTSVSSGLTVNHAPYAVTNDSTSTYGTSEDATYYAAQIAENLSSAQPIGVGVRGIPLPAGTPPPAAIVTTSAANSADGGTSWGMEFALSPSYLGLDTTEDSWTSAEMAGFIAALLYNKPAFNFFDVRAALRITAANWATGYDASHFGYGVINWSSANAIASTGSLYLQPPKITASLVGNSLTIIDYPFRQTRRDHEVIYLVAASYAWPLKNEYTATDIANSHGTLLFTTNSTDVIPSDTFTLSVSPGIYNVIGFTTDNLGAFSRFEPYSPVPIMGQCL